jgi:putative flippase GtrA
MILSHGSGLQKLEVRDQDQRFCSPPVVREEHDFESCRNRANAEIGALAPKSNHRGASSALARWCKFNFVGGLGIAVQFAALFLLKSVLHFDYLVATALAVEAAVVHNFVWHEQFTWVDRVKPDRVKPDRINPDRTQPSWRRSLPRFLRFNLANGAVSILGNLTLMKVLVGQGHVNYLVANGIAITVCSLANFLISDKWVFEE